MCFTTGGLWHKHNCTPHTCNATHCTHRYALARALGPGTCLRSEPFTAGAQAFQLEVFPAGLAADCCQHLSLFLTTPGGAGSSADHILYELAVVDQVCVFVYFLT